MRRFVLLVAIVINSSCGYILPRVRVPPTCSDGLPVKVLIDPRCPPDGICGYTCDPDRWIIKDPNAKKTSIQVVRVI
jgi:hypothetical protein